VACLTDRRGDERGVVYVEFLIAFMPVFLLFLAVCELALLSGAMLVVRHAAYRAARCAIVVLEDDPEAYGGAPRGSLSSGTPDSSLSPERLLALIGQAAPLATEAPSSDLAALPQRGARMAPIRTSAYLPLLTLAPRALDPARTPDGPTLSDSFVSPGGDPSHALAYTRSASAITVHTQPGNEALAAEPVGRDASVSVRVTYLYSCSVPLVRTLMCRSLTSLLPLEPSEDPFLHRLVERMRHAEAPGALTTLVSPGSRLRALSAEVTLPNQGAAYDHAEGG
jgi:hypothetical protein